MMANHATRLRIRYVAGDLLATAVAWFAFNAIRFFNVILPEGSENWSFIKFLHNESVWLGQILFPIGMCGLYFLSGYYDKVYGKSRVEELVTTLTTAFIGTICVWFLAIIDDPIPDKASNYELFLMLFGLLFGCVYIMRLMLTNAVMSRIKRGAIKFNALIVGTSDEAKSFAEELTKGNNPYTHAYQIVGYIAPDDASQQSREIDGRSIYSIDEIEGLKQSLDLKAIIVPEQAYGIGGMLQVLNRLWALELPVLVSPNLSDLITSRPKIRRMASMPLVDISQPNISDSAVRLKRLGDILASAVALVILSPVYLALAIAVKYDSRGPVFYSQERIGMHRKKFNIYKFRTMQPDAEKSGPTLSNPDDKRITRLGRFLRKYRLDELPQFWNVFKGDMSLVGPRPERAFFTSQIIEKAPYYALLHRIRPGISSLGMVKFGYASNVDDMVKRLKYDLIYIDNISFSNDLKILVYTVSTVVTGKGI